MADLRTRVSPVAKDINHNQCFLKLSSSFFFHSIVSSLSFFLLVYSNMGSKLSRSSRNNYNTTTTLSSPSKTSEQTNAAAAATSPQSFGLMPSASELDTIWKDFDIDGSGTLEFSEARMMMAVIVDTVTRSFDPARLYRMYEDRYGPEMAVRLLEEARYTLRQLHTKMDMYAERLLALLDSNGDGIVEEAEFKANFTVAVTRVLEGKRAAVSRSTTARTQSRLQERASRHMRPLRMTTTAAAKAAKSPLASPLMKSGSGSLRKTGSGAQNSPRLRAF